jgi:hypothetical protein
MSKILTAPWNDDQVISLNTYQTCKWHHPSTCGEREEDETHHVLVATSQGWTCPKCMAKGKRYLQT